MGSGAVPLWARKAPPSLNSSHMHELKGEPGGRGMEGARSNDILVAALLPTYIGCVDL